MQKLWAAPPPPLPPPSPTISWRKARSFAITSKTHKKPANTVRKSHLFQLHYTRNSSDYCPHPQQTFYTAFSQSLILFTFSLTLLSLRLTSGVLLPDFSRRWRQLISFSSQAEAELRHAPEYLFEAVVVYEDRRFFSHFGVDPIGLARAVLSLSARGGGSTITQQLVKNTFLKNERTLLRKFIEIVLAAALERRISKVRILSAYLCKIYWGHGIYGIKPASDFYFGKQPSLLKLGECALLIGMIPAPELRSPFRDYRRGKTFQARVLKRMVDGGFLDIESALSAIRESVHLKPDHGADDGENTLSTLAKERRLLMARERGSFSSMKGVWDWERESTIWEVEEEMERWAVNKEGKRKSSKLQSRHI